MTEHEPLAIDSARRHDVTHADMLHAFRNPVRTFLVGDDMTMVIGADSAYDGGAYGTERPAMRNPNVPVIGTGSAYDGK